MRVTLGLPVTDSASLTDLSRTGRALASGANSVDAGAPASPRNRHRPQMFRLLVPIMSVTLSFGRLDLEQLTQRYERHCSDNVYPLAFGPFNVGTMSLISMYE
jgi:hypothetical protein